MGCPKHFIRERERERERERGCVVFHASLWSYNLGWEREACSLLVQKTCTKLPRLAHTTFKSVDLIRIRIWIWDSISTFLAHRCKNKGYLLPAMVWWRTFNIHRLFPLYKRFVNLRLHNELHFNRDFCFSCARFHGCGCQISRVQIPQSKLFHKSIHFLPRVYIIFSTRRPCTRAVHIMGEKTLKIWKPRQTCKLEFSDLYRDITIK